jgi:hypothetical protein
MLNITQPQGTGRTAFSRATTAPKASCLVTTGDAVNQYTADFSSTTSAIATVTVTTRANAAAAVVSVSSIGIAGGILLVIVLIQDRGHAKQLRLVLLGALVVAITGWPACGIGSERADGAGGRGSNGTTPGNYTVTANAYSVSSSDVASPSATTTFNLAVV